MLIFTKIGTLYTNMPSLNEILLQKLPEVDLMVPYEPTQYSKQHYIFKFLICIQLQLSAFSPLLSTPPQPVPPASPTSTLPLDFVLVSFIVAPIDPSPHYPLPTPLWLLLQCS